MIQNISIRVPWHDNKWNGNICKEPKRNISCLRLKAITESKDENFECKHCNKCMKGKEEFLHCIRESGAFMSEDKLSQTIEHPYKLNGNKEYQHMVPTTIDIFPYSFVGRCFDWLMVGKNYKKIDKLVDIYGINFDKDIEPNIGFESNWAQNAINQKAIMDEFYKEVKPKKSIVIAYAKQVPFVEDVRRVVVAIGNVKKIVPAKEYKVIKGTKNSYRGMTFETIIEHTIREDNKEGFIIPYEKILKYIDNHKELSLDINEYTIFAPNENFYDFSFATQHVSYDATLAILLQCKKLYKKITKILNEDFSKELKWIDKSIDAVKKERGEYPGLPVMLLASGITKGVVLGKYILDKVINNPKLNIWDEIENALKNRKNIDNNILKNSLEKADYLIWQSIISDEIKYKLIKLLSRFELTRAQAKFVWENNNNEKYDISAKKILNNPYELYEKTRLKAINYLSLDDDSVISIKSIDTSLLKKDNSNSKYPLEIEEPIDGIRDERRIRAIVISILEEEITIGNTIMFQDELIDKINDYFSMNEENAIMTTELLNSMENFFKSEIIIRCDISGNKYYKLERINKFDTVIEEIVKERIDLKDNTNKIDWDKEYIENEEIKKITKSIPTNKRKIIKTESTTALDILGKRKISVLTGGAGVGKTTLINVFCSNKSISKNGVLLLAPTGKATVNLKSKVGGSDDNVESLNVAQFLVRHKRYDGNSKRYHLSTSTDYIEHKTIIIDEASMLTVDMLAALFEVCKLADRIILVGDPNQLPPIGGGKPFVDTISLLEKKESDKKKYIAKLSIIKRQLLNNDNERYDLLLADCFKYSKTNAFSNIFDIIDKSNKNIEIIKYEDKDELDDLLEKAIVKTTNMKNADDFENFDTSLGGANREKSRFVYGSARKVEDWQILSPVKNNIVGTAYFNKNIHNKYRDDEIRLFNENDIVLGNENIVYGDKVINIINKSRRFYNYNTKNAGNDGYVANGEIGIACSYNYKYNYYTNKKKLEYLNVEFSSQLGYTYGFTKDNFGKDGDDSCLELAYALTVHKTQGSQFNIVILIINEPCKLLKRELLYTALTRQKDKVIIFYNDSPYKLLKYSFDNNSEIVTRKTDLFANKLIDFKPSYYNRKGKYYDKKLVNYTLRGEVVRSKSELIIADKLYNAGIDYQYEEELILDGKMKLPDFTIHHNGKTIYWEHLGMLDVDSYKKSWENKKKFYKRNNIEEGVNLLTSEDKNGGIDSREIEKNIAWILKL